MKLLFCGMLLATCLTGNVFAADLNGSGAFNFLGGTINAVLSFLRITDPCEGRICTNCKPGLVDSDGTCRPE